MGFPPGTDTRGNGSGILRRTRSCQEIRWDYSTSYDPSSSLGKYPPKKQNRAIEEYLAQLAADAAAYAGVASPATGVTSATAGSSKASPKKKTWQEEKNPAADVVSAKVAPIPRGSVAGMASATAAPAAAAVSVRPCGCTNVRLKQASAPAGPAASSDAKGKDVVALRLLRRGLRRQLGRRATEPTGNKLGTDTRRSTRSSFPTMAPNSTTMCPNVSALTSPLAGRTTAQAWTGSTVRTWSSPSAGAFATAHVCRCRQRGFATSLT